MKAIQDLMPSNHCYGCGPNNDKGMRLKSYWDGDETVCRYQPRPEQCAGPTNYVYGGTIASVIDCHSIGTAISNYYRLEGRETGELPEIWCVTGKLSVSYLAPTPIDQELLLRARIREAGERKSIVDCSVTVGDTVTATAEVIAVRVRDGWKKD